MPAAARRPGFGQVIDGLREGNLNVSPRICITGRTNNISAIRGLGSGLDLDAGYARREMRSGGARTSIREQRHPIPLGSAEPRADVFVPLVMCCAARPDAGDKPGPVQASIRESRSTIHEGPAAGGAWGRLHRHLSTSRTPGATSWRTSAGAS